MKFLFTFILVLVLVFHGTGISLADATVLVKPVVIQPPTIPELIAQYAAQYKVSATQMEVVMTCESSLDPTKVGDNGTSFGLSQIHLPAHPDVTKEEALDPVFAVEFMAKEFSEGQQHLWTCYRLKYSNTTTKTTAS